MFHLRVCTVLYVALSCGKAKIIIVVVVINLFFLNVEFIYFFNEVPSTMKHLKLRI